MISSIFLQTNADQHVDATVFRFHWTDFDIPPTIFQAGTHLVLQQKQRPSSVHPAPTFSNVHLQQVHPDLLKHTTEYEEMQEHGMDQMPVRHTALSTHAFTHHSELGAV